MSLIAPSDPAALFQRIQDAIAGRDRQREAGSWSPASRYLDAQAHVREQAALKRYPLPVAAVATIPLPGDWVSVRAHDLPLCIVRQTDGSLKALVNVCRHRGAAIHPDSTQGQDLTRMTCPYHHWTYDASGACVARPANTDFAHAPMSGCALKEVPCTSAFGLVWVVPSVQVKRFDWSSYFGWMGTELSSLGFGDASTSPHQRQFNVPCNWKLCVDANVETYHFPFAHKNTIASMFERDTVIQDRNGPHQRLVFPKTSARSMTEAPTSLSGYATKLNISYFFFPYTMLLWEGTHFNGYSLSPQGIDNSQVNAWLLTAEGESDRREPRYWERNFHLFWQAIDEDFAMCESMQQGLASGANEALCFGANELACTHFHDTLERVVQAQ